MVIYGFQGGAVLKIYHNTGVAMERGMPVKERVTQNESAFSLLLQEKKESMTKERLANLITQIDRQAEQLSRCRTLRNLKVYKNMIRDFVQEVVHSGLELKETTSGHLNGRQRHLKIIQEVDKQLMELSNHVLDERKTSIDILEKIGEIKGLLINLYQ
jgi:uncharacterized protein YaaR (DUF327 family)